MVVSLRHAFNNSVHIAEVSQHASNERDCLTTIAWNNVEYIHRGHSLRHLRLTRLSSFQGAFYIMVTPSHLHSGFKSSRLEDHCAYMPMGAHNYKAISTLGTSICREMHVCLLHSYTMECQWTNVLRAAR